MVSPHRNSLKFLKKFAQAERNIDPDPGNPSKFLIWPLAIVIAAAVVKPDITGVEINCTKNPRFKSPSTRVNIPYKNVRRTAKSGFSPATNGWVIIAIIAVGPMVTALQLPNMV